MNLSTLAPSLIRTYVPVAVGAFIAWLVTLGVTLDQTVEQGLTVFLTGLLIAVYYTVVRLLEKRWPALSFLLGSSTMPAQYTEDGAAVITTVQSPSTGSVPPLPGKYPHPRP